MYRKDEIRYKVREYGMKKASDEAVGDLKGRDGKFLKFTSALKREYNAGGIKERNEYFLRLEFNAHG